MEVDFSDILDRSRALRSRQEANASSLAPTIPRLERALPQIDLESRRLIAQLDPNNPPNASGPSSANAGVPNSVAPPTDDPRALRLLSEYGFETDRIERTLQSVALRDVFHTVPSLPDTDLAAHLAAAREMAVTDAVYSAVKRAKDASLHALSATLDADWEAAKRELVTLTPVAHPLSAVPSPSANRMSRASLALPSPFRQPRANRLSLPAPAASPGNGTAAALHQHRQSHYPMSAPVPTAPPLHAVIRRLLHARSSSVPHLAVSTDLDDALLLHHTPRGNLAAAPRAVQYMHAIFTALRYIFNEHRAAPPPAAHADSSPEDIAALVCRGARNYLCLQFREDKMRREIEARPVEARRGGQPGVRADVRAYLNLLFNRGVPDQLARGPSVDGLPFWPQIYYCLRAGYVDEALDVSNDIVAAGISDPAVLLFHKCLTAYVESGEARCVPNELLTELVQHYGVAVRRGSDPYQRVSYVVIARVDPAAGDMVSLDDADYSLLFYSIEDYLWLLMSIVRMPVAERLVGSLSAYSLSLSRIGGEMRRFGPVHFDKQGDTPTFYALVLVLTGQFAEAVNYLNSGGRAVEEAVHIALVLHHYGALRTPIPGQTGEGAEYHAQLAIDYAELLWRYVTRFLKSDPAVAASYIFTVRESAVRNELLKKVILESKAFNLLLGRPGSEAVLSAAGGAGVVGANGVIAELWEYADDDNAAGRDGWVSVVVGAADQAELRGDRDSAMLLYDIAGVANKVVGMLMERMSAELTSRGSSTRAKVFEAARMYHTRLTAGTTGVLGGRRGAAPVGERASRSLKILLSLGELFDMRWDGRLEEARQLLESLNLLPRADGEVVHKLSELSRGSRVWDESVCDRVPDVLLIAMEILAEIYVSGRNNGRFGGRVEWNGLRAWAKTLVSFSGMMRGLSPDISAKLVRFEVMMS